MKRRRNPSALAARFEGVPAGAAAMVAVWNVMTRVGGVDPKRALIPAGVGAGLAAWFLGGGTLRREATPFAQGVMGGALLAGVVAALRTPDAPAPAPVAPTPAVVVALQLQADPIEVQPGHSYAAVVVTHGAVNAATQAQVVAKAQSLGFTDVNASTTRPAGFPGGASGDWYVTAKYVGAAAQSLARKNGSALAGADVVDAWQTS